MDLGTPTATKLIGALALLAIAGLGWTFVVGPETSALSEARQEVVDTRDQNAVLAAQLAALRKQSEQLTQTRRTARELAELFPPTADQPGLFEQVTAAAVDAGIGADGVTTLSPTPPQVGTADASGSPSDGGTAAGGSAPDLARQSVIVTATGTYEETLRLLENLEDMDRAYLVTSVSTGDDGQGGYTTTVTGDMFVMPPVADPGEALDLASAAPNDETPEG